VTKLEKSIEIEATPEEAFAFLLDKNKMNEAGKGFSQFEYTSKGPIGVGTTKHVVAGSGKSKTEYDSKIIEFVINEKLVSRTIGASKFKSTESFTLEPTPKGTKVTYSMDYEMPYSVLGKLIDKVSVHKKMEEGISNAMENAKKTLEAN
jgi:carbon monoxide dehydrogenase subunit G